MMLKDFNPLTPFGFMVMMLHDRRARLRTAEDRGASAVEWVLITAIVIALVAIISGVIVARVRDKANTLNLDTPAP